MITTAMKQSHWPIEIPDRLDVWDTSTRHNIHLRLRHRDDRDRWDLTLQAHRTAKRMGGLILVQPWRGLSDPYLPDIESFVTLAKELATPRSSWFYSRHSFQFVGFQHETGLRLFQAMVDVAADLPGVEELTTDSISPTRTNK